MESAVTFGGGRLLDEGERQLLLRLSAFSEGWTYEAMEAVCYAGTAGNRSRH